jgi:hypothetical protein
MINKTCQLCFKEYSTYDKQSKFCSQQCYYKGGTHNGKVVTEETRQKLREINLGKKYSIATKQKHSRASKKMWKNEEFRLKAAIRNSGKGNGMYGKKHTKEAKNSISILNSKDRSSNYFLHSIKINIIKKMGMVCEWCNKKINYKEINMHHLDRDRKNNNEDNLVLLCQKCHRGKAHKDFYEKQKHDKSGKYTK